MLRIFSEDKFEGNGIVSLGGTVLRLCHIGFVEWSSDKAYVVLRQNRASGGERNTNAAWRLKED